MKAKQTGFTLIELMMVVAILGVLAGVGYPSYTKHIQKANRANAQIALVSIAAAMQQWRMERPLPTYEGATLGNIFSDDPNVVFSNQVPSDCDISLESCTSRKTYTLNLSTPNAQLFELTALAVNNQTDDECYTLHLNSQGTKTAKKIDGSDVEGCWE